MKKYWKIIVSALAAIAVLLPGCIQLTGLVIPDKVDTDSTFEAHIKGSVKPETDYGPEGMALAILVPKAWNVGETAELYMSTTNLETAFGVADLVDEKMVQISSEPLAKPIDGFSGMTWAQAYTVKHGDLGNVGGDMEWLIYKNGTTEVSVNGNASVRVEIDVKIVFKTTSEPIKCVLGFEFAGAKEGWEGVGFKENLKTHLITVGDGTVNYMEYPLTSTIPEVWRYGDFFAVNFASEAGGVQTDLYGENEIYMCGTAILEDGTPVKLDRRDNSTKMSKLDEKTYQKYIFPTQYFGLSNKTKIQDLYFYFTNKDGSKVVTSNDFEYGFQFRQAAK